MFLKDLCFFFFFWSFSDYNKINRVLVFCCHCNKVPKIWCVSQTRFIIWQFWRPASDRNLRGLILKCNKVGSFLLLGRCMIDAVSLWFPASCGHPYSLALCLLFHLQSLQRQISPSYTPHSALFKSGKSSLLLRMHMISQQGWHPSSTQEWKQKNQTTLAIVTLTTWL